ncbi:hypothetical protein MKEN_00405600 [Mycena kentingensis (nom. inval.)]|nr:hypothetical protein MKEN_00405600 [Mycena kentingensis (nom. inval.)]
MPFSDLDEDLVPRILEFCDVRSALRVGQTSRLLRELSQKRTVWRALLEDLAYRGVLHRLPENALRDYSATCLCQEVKRAVCGPETWLPDSTRKPIPLRTVTLTSDSVSDALSLVRVDANFIFLQRAAILEMWSIPDASRVWSRDVSSALGGDTDMQESRKEVQILLCYPAARYWGFKLTKVDLETQQETTLLEILLLGFGWCRFSLPVVCGRLVLAAVKNPRNPDQPLVLLIDWRSRLYTMFPLDGIMSRALTANLTSDHVTVAYASPAPLHDLHLAVYSVSSIPRDRWFPLATLAPDTCVITHATPMVSQRLSAVPDPEDVTLVFDKNPLVHNSFVAKLYVSGTYDASTSKSTIGNGNRLVRFGFVLRRTASTVTQRRATLFTFTLTRSPTAPGLWTWRAVSSVPAVSRLSHPAMSLAGYVTLQLPQPERTAVVDVQLVRAGVKQLRRREVSLEGTYEAREGWRVVAVAQTSAAAVWVKGKTLRVVYYR